jgi:hypothetical protein
VGEVNRHLVGEGRGYLLVGPGRWGTADRWLGIPAAWHQISGARIITELAVPGFRVDPSQGTHFFHNITSLRIGYFTVDLTRNGEWVDLEFLESLPAITESSFLRHVRLEHPLAGRISSREGLGVVVRLPARVHGSSDAIPAV